MTPRAPVQWSWDSDPGFLRSVLVLPPRLVENQPKQLPLRSSCGDQNGVQAAWAEAGTLWEGAEALAVALRLTLSPRWEGLLPRESEPSWASPTCGTDPRAPGSSGRTPAYAGPRSLSPPLPLSPPAPLYGLRAP